MENLRDELNMTVRPDRIGPYLKEYLSSFLFSEFSPEFLKGHDLSFELEKVPVPLRGEDIKSFAGGNGINANVLADNMVWIMGCDPHFKYVPHYLLYMKKVFDDSLAEKLIGVARTFVEDEEFKKAFVYVRAALLLKPKDREAMYMYAMVTRDMYSESEDEEFIGRCKADSIEYLELLTVEHPEFAQGYYYLGFAYLNLGLYLKSKLTWEKFIELSDDEKEIKEIKERLETQKDPVRIEEGTNEAMAGRYENAIEILEPFTKTKYEKWWPLHYYLGVCYLNLENKEEAEKSFKEVLKHNPSHLKTIEELEGLYEAIGDTEKAEKYRKKAEIIEENNKEN